MNVQNSYQYILIGLALRLLFHCTGTTKKETVIGTHKDLIRELETLNFPVSKSYMEGNLFHDTISAVAALPNDSDPIGELSSKVNRQFRTLENVIFAEANIKNVYSFPERRFNSQYLIEKPEKLLKDGVFLKLNDVARQDISSACRCLLVGEATAAAFHILRATEAVLKTYYFLHRKQNRLNKPMWGNMVDQLKTKTRNKPPPSLLNALDNIRVAYRNPTQHPEATYEIDSAQDLFGVCLDVIGKMGNELPTSV